MLKQKNLELAEASKAIEEKCMGLHVITSVVMYTSIKFINA